MEFRNAICPARHIHRLHRRQCEQHNDTDNETTKQSNWNMLSRRRVTAKQKNAETFYFRKCSTTNVGTVVALVLHQNENQYSISHFIVVGARKGYANARSSVSLLAICDGWRVSCLQCSLFTVWRRRRHRKPIKSTRLFSILSWAVYQFECALPPSFNQPNCFAFRWNQCTLLIFVGNLHKNRANGARAATTVFTLISFAAWTIGHTVTGTQFIGHSRKRGSNACVQLSEGDIRLSSG